MSNLMAGSFQKEFKMSPGKMLEIDIKSGGSVEIEGWNKSLIFVEVNYRGPDIDPDRIEFQADESGLRIDVADGEFQNSTIRSLKFNIQLPKKFNIDIETMGGSIIISEVEGKFTGQTMGGSLYLDKLKGKADLTTMGGEIGLTNSELDGSLKTMGGEIIFDNVVGDVEGTSMGGNVTYRNVMRRDGKPRGKDNEIDIRSMGGDILVDDAENGANVHTMGGEIVVKNAKSHIIAQTMGGDINIEEIDGWIKATTMGGDIKAVMIGDPKSGNRSVKLTSMGGTIDLTLPKDLSANFDIRLSYTKNSRQNFEIDCDFDIKVKESEKWDYSKGSAKKYITGAGKVKDGKHHIRIETVNGDIRIRKGD
jgi:DUF4097 and DUF4098 domain-containing protein YvlB